MNAVLEWISSSEQARWSWLLHVYYVLCTWVTHMRFCGVPDWSGCFIVNGIVLLFPELFNVVCCNILGNCRVSVQNPTHIPYNYSSSKREPLFVCISWDNFCWFRYDSIEWFGFPTISLLVFCFHFNTAGFITIHKCKSELYSISNSEWHSRHEVPGTMFPKPQTHLMLINRLKRHALRCMHTRVTYWLA